MREDEIDDEGELPDYSEVGAVRGKYADRYPHGTIVVTIDPDLVRFFPDAGAVNRALRSVAELIEEHTPAESAAPR
jgi:hypothetical protein